MLVYMCICVYMCVYITYSCVCACMYTCSCMRMYVTICSYKIANVHACSYIYVCIAPVQKNSHGEHWS